MALVRAVLRGIQLAGYFVRFGLELAIERPATRQARAEWLHRFCSTAMRGLGIAIDRGGGEFPRHGALLSNHTSYLDIVTYAALHPCVFCAKAEIRHWPGMGWMTTMAGTIFVDRGRGDSAIKAKAEMQAAVDAGLCVVFFPEGTTTNGTELLPFRSGLLMQLMAVGAPITAARIRYTLTGDNAPGTTVENDVCWWGSRPLMSHLIGLLGLRGLRADVRFAPSPIAFVNDAAHRKLAAIEASGAVLALAAKSDFPLRQSAKAFHP